MTKTWDKVLALKSKDNRQTEGANNLSSDELQAVYGTIDYFGGNWQQAFQDLDPKAKANIDGVVVPFAPRYRIFDFLGMCVQGDRVSSEEATKVLVYAFFKTDGDVNKWLDDLRSTDYDIIRDWEALEL